MEPSGREFDYGANGIGSSLSSFDFVSQVQVLVSAVNWSKKILGMCYKTRFRMCKKFEEA